MPVSMPKQQYFPQVVHWHDVGHPASGSLVYNLDPFDANDSSQARQDSQYSMTMLVSQPIPAPAQDFAFPVHLSPVKDI